MLNTTSSLFNKIVLRKQAAFWCISRLSSSVTVSSDPHVQNNLDPFAIVDAEAHIFLKELNPPIKRSFNLAAHVNHSKTLKELLKIGVSLFDIENTNYRAAQNLLQLDFERDCLCYIRFLTDNGLHQHNLGRFISEYPTIFIEPLDDLQTRLNYYESKKFTKQQIAAGLNSSSHFISHRVKNIDHQLGLLQVAFSIPSSIVRNVVSQCPRIIALEGMQYKVIRLMLNEEFGFSVGEVQKIINAQPCLLEFCRSILIERFDLVHNQIGISHSQIAQYPKLMTGPRVEIAHRGKYLQKLKRNQYNPRKPLYIPPWVLYKVDDEHFCERYAKTSLSDYKLFLKCQ